MAYPWRAVWNADSHRVENINKFLISVPKKKLRHAVDRVKMRRRCREAYRTLQSILPPESNAYIAFIYIGNGLSDYFHTQKSINKILTTIAGKLSARIEDEE